MRTQRPRVSIYAFRPNYRERTVLCVVVVPVGSCRNRPGIITRLITGSAADGTDYGGGRCVDIARLPETVEGKEPALITRSEGGGRKRHPWAGEMASCEQWRWSQEALLQT